MKYFLIIFFLITIYQLPITAGAVSIWDGTSGGGCNITGPCTFCDALIVIRNIIMLLFEIAIPLAVVMIVYGAFRLMLAGGSQENVATGKKIMTNAFVGMMIALGAWIIVNTILHILGDGRLDFWNQINCS